VSRTIDDAITNNMSKVFGMRWQSMTQEEQALYTSLAETERKAYAMAVGSKLRVSHGYHGNSHSPQL